MTAEILHHVTASIIDHTLCPVTHKCRSMVEVIFVYYPTLTWKQVRDQVYTQANLTQKHLELLGYKVRAVETEKLGFRLEVTR